MTMTYDDSYYDALFLWAFDPPPIGRPGRSVPAVRIAPHDKPPQIQVDGRLYPVIGVTPSGWLSTVGLGWCRFTGTRETIPLIAGACKPVVSRLLDDCRRFNAALHRYMALPDTGFCAGLPETDLGTGRSAIRLDDITVPEVRTALQRFLDDLGPDFDGRLVGDLRVAAMPEGYLDSTLWWWFARTWKGEDG